LAVIEMLDYLAKEELFLFVSKNGGANSILHYGQKNTIQIILNLEYTPKIKFFTNLLYKPSDSLEIVSESYSQNINENKQSNLEDLTIKGMAIPGSARPSRLIPKHVIYQFNDTTITAKIRQSVYINDNHFLHSDAGNLAAFLYMLKIAHNDYYKRITSTIKLAVPFFGDFDLEPNELNPNMIMLNWREQNSEYLFGPHQFPDGMLRFIALTTLLLQPEKFFPQLLIIDEPELGLHPYALAILASMVNKASKHCQIILATQSETLLDHFDAKDVIVVTRKGGESEFKRVNEAELKDWLEEYTLSELWDKNVFDGGRPSR
jgi:predicted ATPase